MPMPSRTVLVGAMLVLMTASHGGTQPGSSSASIDIDHVILAINDLDAGIEAFARVTGVKAVRGGEHPGRGTQNALVSLGAGRYVEIMAPMPSAPKPAAIPFTRLTPAGWALHARDLPAIVSRLKDAGFETVGPTPGSRRRPDGSLLEWQTAGARGAGLDLAPFLIEWAAGARHPSTDSPSGCQLGSLELADPEPAALQRFFEAVGYKARVSPGERSMRLTLECRGGKVSFPL